MGRALARISSSDIRFELVAVVTGRNVSPIEAISCPMFAINQLEELPRFDVLVDFSQPEAFESIRAAQAVLGPEASVEALVRASLRKPG